MSLMSEIFNKQSLKQESSTSTLDAVGSTGVSCPGSSPSQEADGASSANSFGGGSGNAAGFSASSKNTSSTDAAKHLNLGGPPVANGPSHENGLSPEGSLPASAQVQSQAPATPSDEIAGLKNRVQELELQLKDKDNKYLYLVADFDNFKKRAQRDRSDLLKFGWEHQARELLQVLDNLERVVSHLHPQLDKNFASGVQMVLDQFKSLMEKQGVTVVECLQKIFDPHLHDAISHEASDAPSGTVIKEEMRGYTFHGRLLRPSRVVVSSGKKGL